LSGESGDLAVSKTADEVVVDHPRRLHVGVDDGRTDETETAFLEVLRDGLGDGCGGGNLGL